MTTLTLHPDTTAAARVVLTYDSQTVSDLGLASEYINDATVTFDLWDSAGTQIVTDLSLGYVSGSDGVYRGLIADDIGIQIGSRYKYQYTATLPSGSQWVEDGYVYGSSPS